MQLLIYLTHILWSGNITINTSPSLLNTLTTLASSPPLKYPGTTSPSLSSIPITTPYYLTLLKHSITTLPPHILSLLNIALNHSHPLTTGEFDVEDEHRHYYHHTTSPSPSSIPCRHITSHHPLLTTGEFDVEDEHRRDRRREREKLQGVAITVVMTADDSIVAGEDHMKVGVGR